MPFPDYSPTLPEAWRESVASYGHNDFLIAGAKRYSYRNVDEETSRLARGLLASGVGKGSRVGILMPNSPEWVIAFLAVTRIGGLAVPISTLYQPRELREVIPFSDISLLLCSAAFSGIDFLQRLEEAFPELSSQSPCGLVLTAAPYLRRVVVWGDSDRTWCAKGPDELVGRAGELDDNFLRLVEDRVCPADLLLMIYTSGSTATPKGVVHTHGTVVRHTHVLDEHFDYAPDDRVLTQMPFFWLGGLNYNLFPIMYHGAALCFARSNDRGDVLDAILDHRCTQINGWPQQTERLKRHPKFATSDYSFMKPSVLGMPGGFFPARNSSGEPVPSERVSSALGMTETFGPHSRGPKQGIVAPEKAGTCGAALPGIDRKIVDPQTGEVLPPGEPGELLVRGYSLMAGYYRREREETFDPDGYFRTGDMCVLDEDGYLYFRSRLGEMIKTMGANVAPREVELVLESFSDVYEAAVIGLPDDELGEVLVAVLVPAEGASPTAEELIERLKGELSAYKVPREIRIANLLELPRTGSNKLNKVALRNALIVERAIAK
jgi:acyl-CoA synthetase (AMP-forming)/AMP-acid ligase II